MTVSRRGFLQLALGVAAGALAALLAARHATAWLRAPLRALSARLRSPRLGDAPAGPLSAEALTTLLAATAALAGGPVQLAHYEDFFRWRAEHLRGYKDLYEQFAAAFDRRAQRSLGRDFAAWSRRLQQQVLAEPPRLHSGETGWRGVRVAVLEREWLRFDKYIVPDVLLLFLGTDAWTALGYEAWPGTPRGLERYTQAPGRGR
jgi:hypothetical protein